MRGHLSKMDKTARKLQNQNFGGKKTGHTGTSQFFLLVGEGVCSSFPPLGEILKPKGFLMFSGGSKGIWGRKGLRINCCVY